MGRRDLTCTLGQLMLGLTAEVGGGSGVHEEELLEASNHVAQSQLPLRIPRRDQIAVAPTQMTALTVKLFAKGRFPCNLEGTSDVTS